MIRGTILAAALAVAPAAEAAAVAPRAIARAGADEAVALAGEAVLVTRTGGTKVDVDRYPLDGGPPSTILSFGTPGDETPAPPQMSASSTTAAALMGTLVDHDLAAVQPFAGPAAGPLHALAEPRRFGGRRFVPITVAVEGDRVVHTEYRADLERRRYVVADPGREPVVARVPAGALAVDFAGDLVAFAEVGPDYAAPRRVVVADWRTGERRWERLFEDSVGSIDLHAEGRAVVAGDGGVFEVAAGGAGSRRISARGTSPAYAGDAIVFEREGRAFSRIYVAGADRRPRPFGVPSRTIDRVVSDGRHVAWLANGCALLAPLDAGTADAPAAGPCARSELAIDFAPTPLRGRTLRAVLHCVAAQPAGCRGTLRVSGELDRTRVRVRSSAVRFRVAMGGRRRVSFRLNRRVLRAVRREGFALLAARGRLVDPDGRRSPVEKKVALQLR